MTEIKIWGIKINPLTKLEIVNRVDQSIKNNLSTFHLTGVNPETISQAQANHELKNSINGSDIVNIDNSLVLLTLRMLGYRIPERAACPDIFELLLSLANTKGYSVYFLGAKEEILQNMLSKLKIKYPKLKISGYRNGYFNNREESEIVQTISTLKPDMLFIALPTPDKELFISKYKKVLGVHLAFGVGGAFDVQAGKVNRAPAWMRKIGLEGTHRALQDPANYGARYIKYYIPFIKLFFRELYKKIPNNKLHKFV